MFIKHIQLMNYRNYTYLDLTLSENVNVFIGDNAQGKTNILEAMYYCGFARSHRTNKDKELVNWNYDKALISLFVKRARIDKKINIAIFKDGKKAINVNSIRINKISELIGAFNVVMFSPENLKIVKESPGVRRRFIDMELSQLDPKYYYNLVQYNKVLNERNSVLKNRNLEESMLDIYDFQLASFGKYIIDERIKYIDKLNSHGSKIHKDITSNKEDIAFKYVSSISFKDDIEEAFVKGLKEHRQRDKERGITSLGPHRDDFLIFINGIDAKSYGSQGQQRTSVLTMKFASLRIIKEQTGEYPVLLLDDVLSELDIKRKKYVLSSIKDIQTIITCTGIEDIHNYLDDKSKVFKVSNGNIVL